MLFTSIPAVSLWLFGDFIKAKIKQLLEESNAWIAGYLAGTKIFKNIVLKKYRNKLITLYQELKIPFGGSNYLKTRDIYVPLKVTGTSDLSLVEVEDAVKENLRLMIKGEPGAGKSMLLKYLALSYAQGKLENLSDRPVPIFIELSSLSDPNLTVDKIQEKLVEICKNNSFPKADRFISQGLKNGNLMLLFDGLDEVKIIIRPHIIECLKSFLKRHEKCRAIITCRTAIYNDEFFHDVNKTLEITRFNDLQIKRFLSAWQLQMPNGKSVERLIKNLGDRPRIMELAKNPLMLTIIAYLYTNIPDFDLPYSRAEFYTKATNILLESNDKIKNISTDYDANDKRQILQHLALYAQNTTNYKQQDRRSITYIEVRQQVKKVLVSLDIEPKQSESILDEIVKRSGLLLRIDGGQRYQFAHQSLQEYFVATALVDDEDELIKQWKKSDTKSDWLEIIKLWCGLSYNSSALIESVFEIDTLTGFECLGAARQVDSEVARKIIDHFKMEIEYSGDRSTNIFDVIAADIFASITIDSRLIGKELFVFLIEKLIVNYFDLIEYKDYDRITNVFGSIAADSRLVGNELFVFLVENLSGEENTVSRKIAARALSMTNLPLASEELAKFYNSKDPIIREALTKMGNLAIPQLKVLAEKNHLTAVEDLKIISTAEAIYCLVNFLWTPDNLNLASISAWHLGDLLKQSEIRKDLRVFNLSIEQRKEKSLISWIWEPFKEPANSAIPIIAGRIAYLLVDNIKLDFSLQNILKKIPEVESRIMIPVCSICAFKSLDLERIWDSKINLLSQFSQHPDRISSSEINIREERKLDAYECHNRWRMFLSALVENQQGDLLYRLYTHGEKFTIEQWHNIYKKVEYDFLKSREYFVLLSMIFFVSSLSVVEAVITLLKNKNVIINTLMVLSIFIVCVFLASLWKELKKEENKLEPDVFLKIGVLGIWTFFREHRNIFNRKNNREGIVTMQETLGWTVDKAWVGVLTSLIFIAVLCIIGIVVNMAFIDHWNTFAIIFLAIFISIGGVLTATFPREIVASMFIIGIILGFIMVVAYMLTMPSFISSMIQLPEFQVYDLTLLCIILLAVFLIAGVTVIGISSLEKTVSNATAMALFGIAFIAGNVAALFVVFNAFVEVILRMANDGSIITGLSSLVFAGILSVFFGLGLETWTDSIHRNSINGRTKLLSLFAFPWFCWCPIVFYFTSSFLYNHLSFRLFPILLCWLFILAISSACWIHGTKLHKEAWNPLRGILGEQI
jgi:hypothetical protein